MEIVMDSLEILTQFSVTKISSMDKTIRLQEIKIKSTEKKTILLEMEILLWGQVT